jgi:biotin operon repressor
MNIENNGFKKVNGMTQNQKIIAHLKRAGSITQREAILDYSIQSLTKRISELREEGFNIISKVKHHPVTAQKYVRYELAK